VPTRLRLELVEWIEGLDDEVLASIPPVGLPVERAGFRGKLEEISLPSLLCILETERRTGILVLNMGIGRGKAQLHLRKGRVLRARMTRGKGPRNADLVNRLIAASRGTFDFHPSSVPFGDEIRSSTAQLIMGGVRRMTQARQPARSESVLSGKQVPELDGPASFEVERASRQRSLGVGVPVDRVAPSVPARRWISPKVAAAAFVIAMFVMVVIMVGVYSGQEAPRSLYTSEAAASSATGRGSPSP
jgi:hypothetical protein